MYIFSTSNSKKISFEDFGNVIFSGLFNLETSIFGQFRWMSDKTTLFINDRNITLLKIKIFSPSWSKIRISQNNNTSLNNIKPGFNIIKIPVNTNIITLHSEHFIPAKKKLSLSNFIKSKFKKNLDFRKQSYKLFKTDLIYTSKSRTIPAQKIFTAENFALENSEDILNKIDQKNFEIYKTFHPYERLIFKPKNQNKGKIKLLEQTIFMQHRSGWHYVIKGLAKLNYEQGTLFDGYLDFFVSDNKSYNQPWIGVFHHPPFIPRWFNNEKTSLQEVLNNNKFKQSLKYCKGIIVLSSYLKNHLKQHLPSHIEILVLHHPTKFPPKKWSYKKFLSNKNKKLINIGFWLRKFSTIKLIKNVDFEKITLLPKGIQEEHYEYILNQELSYFNINSNKLNNVTILKGLSDDEYDDLLSKNIVFLDLIDSSANNTVIECIARGTPLLVNKHPAVIDYLGKDYPFYYNSIDEVESKLKNKQLIKKTHDYLCQKRIKDKVKLSGFIKDFKNSNIYKNL